MLRSHSDVCQATFGDACLRSGDFMTRQSASQSSGNAHNLKFTT